MTPFYLLKIVSMIFSPTLFIIEPEFVWNHMINNKLFHYYVLVCERNIEGFKEKLPCAIYIDYYSIIDMLDEERKKQGLAGTVPIDLKTYKTIFYNDFDIHNKKISKFLEEIKKLPFFLDFHIR